MSTKLSQQVKMFRQGRREYGPPELDIPDPDHPEQPSKPMLQHQLALIAEEVIELFESCCSGTLMRDLLVAKRCLMRIAESATEVDLVGVAHESGDVDFVIECLRQTCGIDGDPIINEISQANLAKLRPGVSFNEQGKMLKPPSWTPPDIVEELRKQGWREE